FGPGSSTATTRSGAPRSASRAIAASRSGSAGESYSAGSGSARAESGGPDRTSSSITIPTETRTHYWGCSTPDAADSVASVPRRTALLFLATGLVTLVAAAPANASLGSGVSITTTQRPDLRSTLQITDPFREDNRMAFATVTPEGGSPDLVVGDLAAGIADPIPTICGRV